MAMTRQIWLSRSHIVRVDEPIIKLNILSYDFIIFDKILPSNNLISFSSYIIQTLCFWKEFYGIDALIMKNTKYIYVRVMCTKYEISKIGNIVYLRIFLDNYVILYKN